MLATGEAGEVEESMRELAAVEALKVEKAEKEVRDMFIVSLLAHILGYSVNCKI